MINKAQFQQNLDKARFGPSTVFLRLQGILRVQRTDGLTTFVWECIIALVSNAPYPICGSESDSHTLHSGEQQHKRVHEHEVYCLIAKHMCTERKLK